MHKRRISLTLHNLLAKMILYDALEKFGIEQPKYINDVKGYIEADRFSDASKVVTNKLKGLSVFTNVLSSLTSGFYQTLFIFTITLLVIISPAAFLAVFKSYFFCFSFSLSMVLQKSRYERLMANEILRLLSKINRK